jgi:hypothetical protein
MYISRLNEDITSFVGIDPPDNLDDTIKSATKIEAEKYYNKKRED